MEDIRTFDETALTDAIKQGRDRRIAQERRDREITVIETIRKGIGQATSVGIQPSDLWLGREEHEALYEPLEGGTYMGLTVRLSIRPGVRVGISWPV